jgi:hypothetical protein
MVKSAEFALLGWLSFAPPFVVPDLNFFLLALATSVRRSATVRLCYVLTER